MVEAGVSDFKGKDVSTVLWYTMFALDFFRDALYPAKKVWFGLSLPGIYSWKDSEFYLPLLRYPYDFSLLTF